MFPRLGVLHFTLAIVFVPFGAPQAETVTAPARPRTTIAARGAASPASALARFAAIGRGSATDATRHH